MGKRGRIVANDGDRDRKRTKTAPAFEAATSEEIHSARQLQQLLIFEQNLGKARHGLQSLKNLLDSIVNDEDQEKLRLLQEYLTAVKPYHDEESTPIYLGEVMDTWSMACQMNNENVMSAVAVVLALLLKILSAKMEYAPYGLGICRTLLQKRQQEFIAKNLSAEKGRDFVISPTLRLVREIICFDGGTLALATFRARANTLKSLARNMGLKYLGTGIEDPKRPSVRTNAVRLFLSALKFLSVEAKRELLVQRDVVAALMKSLREDPAVLIFEILDSLKSHVVLDHKLSRDAKIKLLNAHSLTRIASLYGYVDESEPSVEDAAHEFLTAACTTSAAGILRAQPGYYPDGIDPDMPLGLESASILYAGIESIPWMNKFNDEVPVRNTLLAEFIQSLRPWSHAKQNRLLVSIFVAAPELVANYFVGKRSFTFEPKLSATWIGYASLLFSTIQLPVPDYFGHQHSFARLPPPASVVSCNLLPVQINVKVLSRCLSHKSSLVSFFAIRLLVIALQKLAKILKMYRKATSSSESSWAEASRRLLDETCQRIPDMKDIVNAYRAISEEDMLQRVAASQLLVLYYEVVPQIALKAKFDVSPMLLAAVNRLENGDDNPEDTALTLSELENLFVLAQYSPGMRWFARPEGLSSSPFVTLLKLEVEKSHGISSERINSVLKHISEEHELVEIGPDAGGLRPLMQALQSQDTVSPEIWGLIENCAERCARTPIKYLEMILELVDNVPSKGTKSGTSISPLMMAMGEQLPFLVSSSKDSGSLKSVAKFLSAYLGFSQAAAVDESMVNKMLELFIRGFGSSKAAKSMSVSRKAVASQNTRKEHSVGTLEDGNKPRKEGQDEIRQTDLEDLLTVPEKYSKDANVLSKWISKTPEELVEDGYGASVIWLLGSEHQSIRKEALVAITKMAAKIKESAYEENEQIWLLLMELVESCKERIATAAIPSTILAFASSALDVLRNPLHSVYEKVNTFLTRGPFWDLDKVPLVQDILFEGPAEQGGYYSEVSWLLHYLLDCLRTPEDAGLFHKRKVYERILALDCNPYMGPNLRTQVLRILYRTSSIDGGSDTLITRFGIISWLQCQRYASSTGEDEKKLLDAFVSRLWETCDQARIRAWSSGGVAAVVEKDTPTTM